MFEIDNYMVDNKLKAKRLKNDIQKWIKELQWNTIRIDTCNGFVGIIINGDWSEKHVFNVILNIYNELGMPFEIKTKETYAGIMILLEYESSVTVDGIDHSSDNVDELYEEIIYLDEVDRIELTQRLNKQAMKEFKEDFFRWL